MQKEEILKASRKENKNKDLAELEVIRHAGSYAGTAGAVACCVILVLGSVFAHSMLYSPWVIYFSMLGTSWFVRAIKQKKKSDWVVAVLFVILTVLALIGFMSRLLEVAV